MKTVPQRQCIGCMEMKPKNMLIRVVKSPEGEVSLDVTGKKNGRGAYLCHDPKCLEKAIKAKKLQRAFSMDISEDIMASLKKEMTGLE